MQLDIISRGIEHHGTSSGQYRPRQIDEVSVNGYCYQRNCDTCHIPMFQIMGYHIEDVLAPEQCQQEPYSSNHWHMGEEEGGMVGRAASIAHGSEPMRQTDVVLECRTKHISQEYGYCREQIGIYQMLDILTEVLRNVPLMEEISCDDEEQGHVE